MFQACVALFAVAFAISTALTFLMTRVAPRLGFVDRPGERKVHTAPIPLGGGLAIVTSMFAVVGAAAGVAVLIARNPEFLGLGGRFADYAGGVRLLGSKLATAGAGALVLMVMGLIDDRRGLKPLTKLAVQVFVALLLVAGGMTVTVHLPWKAAGWAATVVWMVFVMNSFNLLDNMDGLSSGVAVIIASVFLAVAVETGQLFIVALLAVFIASVLGFMVFNFPPARIFMGDTGSYFLGYVLGLTAVVFTFVPGDVSTGTALFPLALPFILFAIPFYDTLSVIYLRVREGRHPFTADKRHFSHRLTDLGMTKTEAVFTIYAATLTTAFPALYLFHLNTASLVGAVLQAILVLLLVAILEHAGARKNAD